jgi:hypothetical protein
MYIHHMIEPYKYSHHTMGGGTKKCTICNTSNAAASLFLFEGIFCRRTTVDWKMIDHYLTAGPNMLIKQKWLKDERGCGEERFVRGELFVCMQCTKEAIGHCENVLGYLTLHQKQHHVPYSLAISLNGTFLLINGIASTLWASQYVFSRM